jgi:allantoinase
MSESYDLVIVNGMVVLRDEMRQLDIGIRSGKIVGLAEEIDPGSSEVIDASGMHILPGMIDMHVHFNEPGLSDWEGFESGSAALAAGGCTTYADMPLNGTPPTVSMAGLQQKLEAAKSHSVVDYALWGGLVPGNLDQLELLAEAGVIGFKAFMSEPGGEGEDIFRRVDDWTLYEGMKKIAALGGILALHAESEAIASGMAADIRREGKTGAKDYAASRPVLAELEAVNRALFYAKQTGCSLHFVHISSADAVLAIGEAKKQGLDVTVETCPHYLTLTVEDMESLGATAKCAPPLRDALEQGKLWTLLAAGQIDLIASDHSPCPPKLKQGDNYFDLWGGISGAQSSMELMLEEGYKKRGIALPLLARLLSYNPAVRFGLHPRKGEIRVGADADLALVHLNDTYILAKEHLLDKHKQSPYVGRQFTCRIQITINKGHLAYQVDQGVARSKQGVWIQPTAIAVQ